MVTCNRIHDLTEEDWRNYYLSYKNMLYLVCVILLWCMNKRNEQEIAKINLNIIKQNNTNFKALSSCKHLVFSDRGNIHFINNDSGSFCH
jgi:hypothetical protein